MDYVFQTVNNNGASNMAFAHDNDAAAMADAASILYEDITADFVIVRRPDLSIVGYLFKAAKIEAYLPA